MKQPRSLPDPPAQPSTSVPPAQTRAELIENLAVLVVRQHRQCRRQTPVSMIDLEGPSANPAPTPS